MSNERDRIWRILVDEIQTKKIMIERWRGKSADMDVSRIPQEIIDQQVHGFNCELSALVQFGAKCFGISYEELEAL